MGELKLYSVDFEPMWPVPSGLIILAYSEKQAWKIAKETITHTQPLGITELSMEGSGVVFYESGNY